MALLCEECISNTGNCALVTGELYILLEEKPSIFSLLLTEKTCTRLEKGDCKNVLAMAFLSRNRLYWLIAVASGRSRKVKKRTRGASARPFETISELSKRCTASVRRGEGSNVFRGDVIKCWYLREKP